jgi:hypothetical protein
MHGTLSPGPTCHHEAISVSSCLSVGLVTTKSAVDTALALVQAQREHGLGFKCKFFKNMCQIHAKGKFQRH